MHIPYDYIGPIVGSELYSGLKLLRGHEMAVLGLWLLTSAASVCVFWSNFPLEPTNIGGEDTSPMPLKDFVHRERLNFLRGR